VTELEPAHVTLLVAVALHGQRFGQESERIPTNWASPQSLSDPAVAGVERAGLVRHWQLTRYGRRFLRFLEETGEAEPTT
jgi:hypothetical protein